MKSAHASWTLISGSEKSPVKTEYYGKTCKSTQRAIWQHCSNIEHPIPSIWRNLRYIKSPFDVKFIRGRHDRDYLTDAKPFELSVLHNTDHVIDSNRPLQYRIVQYIVVLIFFWRLSYTQHLNFPSVKHILS